MYTLKQLSVQYGLQAEALYARLRVARAEAAQADDAMDAYLLRRRAGMLREMWRETRDTAALLACYYDGAPSKRRVENGEPRGDATNDAGKERTWRPVEHLTR